MTRRFWPFVSWLGRQFIRRERPDGLFRAALFQTAREFLRLFGEGRSWTVVLDCQQHERGVFEPRSSSVFFRIGHARGAVSQILAESVARDDHKPYIYSAIAECRSEMNHVHHKQVASGGNLHFDANANTGTVHDSALEPVDIAADLPCPATKAGKLLIY